MLVITLEEKLFNLNDINNQTIVRHNLTEYIKEINIQNNNKINSLKSLQNVAVCYIIIPDIMDKYGGDKMKITHEEVKHIAKLAKLSLKAEEVEKYASDLGQIAEFVEKLNEVDITGVNPTAHAVDKKNVFRKDELKDSYVREDILKNAPSKEAGCISVPKVVE